MKINGKEVDIKEFVENYMYEIDFKEYPISDSIDTVIDSILEQMSFEFEEKDDPEYTDNLDELAKEIREYIECYNEEVYDWDFKSLFNQIDDLINNYLENDAEIIGSENRIGLIKEVVDNLGYDE